MNKRTVRYQFLPWTPEGKVERQIQRDLELRQQDDEQRERRRQEVEDRLDAPMTRRELMAALETVRHQYGCNGNHDSDIIENAFRALINEIE